MAPQTLSGQPRCHPETSPTAYVSSVQSEGMFLQGGNWELSLAKPRRVQQGAECSCNAMTASVDSYAAATNQSVPDQSGMLTLQLQIRARQIRTSRPDVDNTQGVLSTQVCRSACQGHKRGASFHLSGRGSQGTG